MKNKILVVGGGIAGIFSALLYAKRGADVTLVEKNEDLGGLLNSIKPFSEDYVFDQGTHLLRETGVKEVDDILFEGLDLRKFDYLKVGSHYGGLFEKNGYISDTFLEDREALFEEFKTTYRFADEKEYVDNKRFIINRFGENYARRMIFPALKKLYSAEPELLDGRSLDLFGLGRIIVGTPEESRILKEDPRFDSILAFHSYLEGLSSRKSMYPTSGGCGAWIESLIQKLDHFGVRVLKKRHVSSFEYGNNVIASATLNDGTVIETDTVVWTAPAYLLIRQLGVNDESFVSKRLDSFIFHYLIDEKYLTDLYYFQSYDPDYRTFRVTLYDNYDVQENTKKYRISVEVLSGDSSETVDERGVLEELKMMGVLSKTTRMLNCHIQRYRQGFPVLTKEFVQNTYNNTELIYRSCDNVQLFGKSRGDKWFMNEVLMDIYQTISEN